MPNMPDSYYDNFNASKNYEKILYRDGYTLQGAELNEAQSAAMHRLQGVADALFKDGDIIRDAGIIVNKETGEVRAQSGAVYLRGAVRGVPEEEIKERVYATLKICGLYQFRNWPVSALSFGQKKRVTIASILVLHPQVLILDEPTAGLDPKERVRLRELLAGMAQDRIILVATHVVSDVESVATKVILLRAGKIVDAAPVPDLIEKHAPGGGLEDVYLNVFGEGDGK